MVNYNYENCKEIRNAIMNDPKYWSNNKRRLHGIPLRRKGKWQHFVDMLTLANNGTSQDILAVLSREFESSVNKMIDSFVEVGKVELGDRNVFKR